MAEPKNINAIAEGKAAAKQKITDAIFFVIKSMIKAIATLFVEAGIILMLWNWILTDYQMTYWKTFGLLIMIRLILRNASYTNQNKK